MLYRIKRVWNPDIFQGGAKKKNYFEGYYFKQVSPGGDAVYAFIPGVAYGSKKEDAHSFVQVINGKTGETHYFSYSIDDFVFSRKDFSICIGENRFSHRGFRLNLKDEEQEITGEIVFEGLSRPDFSFFSPGVMGWYSFVPFMECYHGLVSLDHALKGSLFINGIENKFTGGRGFIEKDWGTSFPRSWIWMQSNGFKDEGVSLMLSVARIPWLGGSFNGFLVFFLCGGEVYRFATYTGALLKEVIVDEKTVSIAVEDKHHSLTVKGRRGNHGILAAPVTGVMDRRIAESLDAELNVSLAVKKGAGEIFSGQGRHSGLEMVGDMNDLMVFPATDN